MTTEKILSNDMGFSFEWVDVSQPSESELENVASDYGLHTLTVNDCLDPHHLPKYEEFDNGSFIILRLFDESSRKNADNVRDFTRKIAIFITEKRIVTIHRAALPFLETLKTKWQTKSNPKSKNNSKNNSNRNGILHLLNEILQLSFESYEVPLRDLHKQLEEIEFATFNSKNQVFSSKKAYTIIRKAAIIKRMLGLGVHVMQRLDEIPEASLPFFNNVKEDAEHLTVWAADIIETTNRVIQLQLSLQAQKTNESSVKTNNTMRILTVFSVFFMPLNFIAGIYGMNFEWMPALKHPQGFWIISGVMLLAFATSLYWFYRSGWLDDSN